MKIPGFVTDVVHEQQKESRWKVIKVILSGCVTCEHSSASTRAHVVTQTRLSYLVVGNMVHLFVCGSSSGYENHVEPSEAHNRDEKQASHTHNHKTGQKESQGFWCDFLSVLAERNAARSYS